MYASVCVSVYIIYVQKDSVKAPISACVERLGDSMLAPATSLQALRHPQSARQHVRALDVSVNDNRASGVKVGQA